jgi:hypothetical protein
MVRSGWSKKYQPPREGIFEKASTGKKFGLSLLTVTNSMKRKSKARAS